MIKEEKHFPIFGLVENYTSIEDEDRYQNKCLFDISYEKKDTHSG